MSVLDVITQCLFTVEKSVSLLFFQHQILRPFPNQNLQMFTVLLHLYTHTQRHTVSCYYCKYNRTVYMVLCVCD